jgi:PDZ domain-containing protein
VAGDGHLAPALGDGAAVRFRGRLHGTTMTDDEHPTTPDTGKEGDPVVDQTFPTAPPPGEPPPSQAPPSPWPTAVPEIRVIDGTPPTGDDIVRPRSARRHSKLRWFAWGAVLVVVLGVFIASRINLDYFAIQPGTAQSVQPFITVPPAKAHHVADPVLLTDVEEARVTALSYLIFKLQSDTALYSVPSVTGGVSPAELDAQGNLQMSQAETAAKVASLRHLGYAVPGTPVGAVIAGTFPGTPAYGVLNVGDVVTAVGGVPTTSAHALTTALAGYKPGQPVTFTVRRNGTAPPGPVTLTLRRTVVEVDGSRVVITVGIEPQDQVRYTYPFPVSIDVVDIGGPSAGLAMTLGVIDTLSGGQLTGGKKVAATGTMDAFGDVGDVGGVAQKTVAVENAGASIFLVPPQEYAAAKSKDRPGLKVYAVSTLDQALRVLAANGGHVPTGTSEVASSNTAG